MEAHPELPPVEKVLNKLIDVAGLVEKRKGVKDIQERRIREAVNLVKNDETTTVKGSKREAYLTFLKLTREVVGDAGVVLCAIALGSSAVGGMKDRVKVELPYALKAKLDLSCNEQLNKLTERYFDTSLSTSSEEGSQPAHNSIETNSITETVIDATPSSQIQQGTKLMENIQAVTDLCSLSHGRCVQTEY